MRTWPIAPRRPLLVALAVAALLLGAATPVAAAPPNDDIAGASPISGLAYSDSGDSFDATTAPDDPDCSGNGPTVWYALTLAEDTRVAANTFGSAYDTTLSVYSGTPGALSQIACNDDFEGLQSRVEFDAIAGETYYLMIGAFASGPGGFYTLSVNVAMPLLELDLQDAVSARVVPKTGVATLSGTVSCSRPTYVDIFAFLQQRSGRATISGFGATSFECDGETSWSVTIYGDNGRFAGGRANFQLYAQAYDAENGLFVQDQAAGRVNLKGGK